MLVGIAYRADTIGLVPGDAPPARWELPVTVRTDQDGIYYFGGPFVHGRRGERTLGLRWGTLASDDTFVVFRAAKLRLLDLEASLVQRALSGAGRLVCSLGLTDQHGLPRCATVRPPDLTWSSTTP